MAQNSKIEWTHHTQNLWHGCTKVHLGCDHCYAETLSHRWGRDIWGNDKPRLEVKSVWSDLKKFQKLAADAGEIHRVFVGSMMDIFEKPMPVMNSKGEIYDSFQTDFLRNEFFNTVIPNSPNLLFLLLTKRPSNINKFIPEEWKNTSPENVMFGTSISTQENEKLVEQLLQVNGKKFLSIEPQIGKIILKPEWLVGENKINWIIQGGESGHGKRPFDTRWADSMREQCKEFHTPYFFKQIDKVQEIPESLLVREFPVFEN